MTTIPREGLGSSDPVGDPLQNLHSASDGCQPTGVRPDPDSELLFDQLLSEARWPEPDAAALARLQSVVATALAHSERRSADNNIPSEHQPEAPARPPFDSSLALRVGISSPAARQNTLPLSEPQVAASRRESRRRSLTLATAVAAALIFAFLAGRWTSPDGVDEVAATDNVEQSSDGIHNPLDSVASSPPLLVPEKDVSPSDSMTATDVPDLKPSTAPNQPEKLQPTPDPLTDKRRRLTQRERMRQQLESVLTCLEEDHEIAASCCRSLLPRRAEFEFLLGEMIRSTTGQRQTAAVTALGFVGTDGSVSMLVQSSATGDLRTAAIEAAKRCSSEQMLAGLVLQKGNSSLRKEFLIELAHRTTPQAAQTWLHLMRTAESRELCLQVVDELSPALIDRLFAELDAPLIDDRMAAILSIGRRADEQTLKRTAQLCQQYPARWESVAILMWNGSEPAIKTLTDLQKDVERYAVLRTAAVQLELAGKLSY